MKSIVNYINYEDKIYYLEVDLLNRCNLNCVLCYRNIFPELVEKNRCDLPIDKWIDIFDKYRNLKLVNFGGPTTEPTLYKDIIPLIDYLKSRGIIVWLFTNGNTHDEKWWNELNTHFTKDDKVTFTICGSTQELHEKYRVGSNLQQIYNHVTAFRKDNKNCNDYCSLLLFKYNENDIKTLAVTQEFKKKFSHIDIVNTYPRYLYFYNVKNNKSKQLYKDFDIIGNYGIAMLYLLQKYTDTYNKYISGKIENYKCEVIELDHILNLDYNGKPYPCLKSYLSTHVDWNKYHSEYGHTMMSDLLQKHSFCFMQKESYIKQFEFLKLKEHLKVVGILN